MIEFSLTVNVWEKIDESISSIVSSTLEDLAESYKTLKSKQADNKDKIFPRIPIITIGIMIIAKEKKLNECKKVKI